MHKHVEDALKILADIGMPKAQRNERSALCLLALIDLTPGKTWHEIRSRLIGITPIMDFVANIMIKNMPQIHEKLSVDKPCINLLRLE